MRCSVSLGNSTLKIHARWGLVQSEGRRGQGGGGRKLKLANSGKVLSAASATAASASFFHVEQEELMYVA